MVFIVSCFDAVLSWVGFVRGFRARCFNGLGGYDAFTVVGVGCEFVGRGYL